jgi:hypothetical protein
MIKCFTLAGTGLALAMSSAPAAAADLPASGSMTSSSVDADGAVSPEEFHARQHRHQRRHQPMHPEYMNPDGPGGMGRVPGGGRR